MPVSINGSTGITGAINIQAAGSVLTGVTTITDSNTTGLVISGIATVAAGSTSAPSITPSGDTNTGLFFPSADTIAFTSGGTERGRWISGGGLTFNGDTAAANALDDYEEGTWTPANSVTTLTTGTNFYQKIGRFVYIQFDFSLATNASGTAITITGLPFTSNGGGVFFGVMMSDNFNILNAFPFVNTGSSTMSFQISATSGGSRDTVAYSRIVSGGVVRGTLCYLT